MKLYLAEFMKQDKLKGYSIFNPSNEQKRWGQVKLMAQMINTAAFIFQLFCIYIVVATSSDPTNAIQLVLSVHIYC